MGFIDKILDTMNLNPDDEDDFDNDDYYFDDEPEETHKSRFSRKEADEEPVSKRKVLQKRKLSSHSQRSHQSQNLLESRVQQAWKYV